MCARGRALSPPVAEFAGQVHAAAGFPAVRPWAGGRLARRRAAAGNPTRGDQTPLGTGKACTSALVQRQGPFFFFSPFPPGSSNVNFSGVQELSAPPPPHPQDAILGCARGAHPALRGVRHGGDPSGPLPILPRVPGGAAISFLALHLRCERSLGRGSR